MSVVVERGLARCPRCVAVADYAFVESGPNSVRYEVHCARCGEDYCEVHAPMAPGFSAAVEALAAQPLIVAASDFGSRRRRFAAWTARLSRRTRKALRAIDFRRR
ncbi:hypothetical protein MMAD_53310 [Mycolicibacterium madagascariense]|uniref:Uncharacterized protein n=1 Tax=Mycolicibacterium madagascariense TaxID=212765 RepID=A0A7I7XP77_9MYCO|nr:hypothetical protein [Mycolicibacterium madagascariense]MCV7014011.1 hypothetical protein [Mycolicibacterium madagascariense]BBZ31036.1 hypothetical protein MMAD_53310 [Mycolicibacterium madagascariense]